MQLMNYWRWHALSSGRFNFLLSLLLFEGNTRTGFRWMLSSVFVLGARTIFIKYITHLPTLPTCPEDSRFLTSPPNFTGMTTNLLINRPCPVVKRRENKGQLLQKFFRTLRSPNSLSVRPSCLPTVVKGGIVAHVCFSASSLLRLVQAKFNICVQWRMLHMGRGH